MNEWTEIRRKVLVEGASKRSIRRDYNIGSAALEKILANSEPAGYRQQAARPKPRHVDPDPAGAPSPRWPVPKAGLRTRPGVPGATCPRTPGCSSGQLSRVFNV